MTTHEVLVRARALIEHEENWSGAGWGSKGSRCALHALDDVAGGQAESCVSDVAIAVARGMEQFLPGSVQTLWSFNDSHSHAEVLAAFDRAIAATAPEPDTDFLNEVRVEEPVSV